MKAEQKRWEVYSSVLASTGIRLVYSGEASTASYDLSTQTVTLPVWDCLDETATQALASHEIGHAKFSTFSLEDFRDFFRRYGDLFNVVEDARIERLMKREFLGLASIFADGYRTLADNGIFPLDGIEKAPLVERLNVFAKFGFMVDVPFPVKEEAAFSYRLMNLSTKTDVIDLCEDILAYLREKPEPQEERSGSESQQDERQDSSGRSEIPAGGEDGDDRGNLGRSLTDSRMRQMESVLQEYAAKEKRSDTDAIIVDSKELVESILIDASFDDLKDWRFDRNLGERRAMESLIEKAAQCAASVFSQKKSAAENASRTKKTIGRIDTKRLAKYAVSDSIFRHMEKIRQGKSHGVVLLVDFSDSMTSVVNLSDGSLSNEAPKLKCACIQAAILGRFCQICGIPFSIYAFGIYAAQIWQHGSSSTVLRIGGSEWFDIGFFAALAFSIRKKYRHVVVKRNGEPLHIACGLSTPMFEATLAARADILKMRAAGIEKPALIAITDGIHNSRLSSAGFKGGNPWLRSKADRLIVDGKPYSLSEMGRGMSGDLLGKTGNWAYELLLGYIKKETGASIVFSTMASSKCFNRDIEYWQEACDGKEPPSCDGAPNERAFFGSLVCEPYLFKRASLYGKNPARKEWVKIFRKPFIEAVLDEDPIFSQFLMMNVSELAAVSTAAKKIENKRETESVLAWMKASSEMLKTYKALALAFIRLFS